MSPATAARILTVEDDPIVQADLQVVLEDAGFEVCPGARDGVEAIDLAREHRPDLVLIDLGLPRMDGIEATRLIFREQAIPIVALTGRSRGDFVERAHEAGAVGHVLKPFAVAELIDTISEALTHRSFGAETESTAVEERRHYHQLATIETMLREDFSEREVRDKLHEQYQADGDSEGATRQAAVRSEANTSGQ